MKCNQVQEKLLHFIGKELSPQIREHLLGCEECERKYRILQETEKSLEDLGGAVRAGSVSMEAPPFLPIRRRSFWQEIRDKLETPVAGVGAVCYRCGGAVIVRCGDLFTACPPPDAFPGRCFPFFILLSNLPVLYRAMGCR